MNIEENNFFNSYKLSDDIIKSLEVLGYRTPTRIQQSVIPPYAVRKQCIGKSAHGKRENSGVWNPGL